jgi:hypothetical protein
MRMQVDQAGQDRAPRCVEHPQGAGDGDVRLDRLDLAEAHANVALAAQLLARIEHLAALDDEVELVVRPHGGAHRRGHGAGGKHATHAGDKAPAAARSHRRLLPEIAGSQYNRRLRARSSVG